MTFLYSLFFGAGVTAFLYTRLGRRVGYGNTQQLVIMMSAIFIVSTAVFFSIFAMLPQN